MRNIVLNIVVAAKKIFRTPTCSWRDFQIRTRQRKKRKTKNGTPQIAHSQAF